MKKPAKCLDKPLVIVSVSARAHAQDAARAIDDVQAWDGYACTDRLPGHRIFGLRDGQFTASVLAQLAAHSGPFALTYGSGLEAHPEWLDLLPANCTLLGNASAILRLCSSPYFLYNELKSMHIPYPEVVLNAPSDASAWLRKTAGRSGGAHVNCGRDAVGGACWQRRVDGTACSAVFLTGAGRAVLVGTAQALPAPDGAYSWAGAIADAALPAAIGEQVQWTAQTLTEKWDLRGMLGIDFVQNAETFHVIDINPRLTASAPLYAPRFAQGYVAAHLAACRGDPLPHLRPTTACRGMQVVYTPSALRVPDLLQWPAEAQDRPTPGSAIAAGEPVCTLTVEAATAPAVQARLEILTKHILTTLEA